MKLKKLFLLSAFGAIAIIGAHNADAQRVTNLKSGNFLQLCKNAKALKACDAYISGIADSVAYSKIFAKNQGDANAPAGFCIATNISGTEMRNKFITWMEGHPDKASQPAGASVFTALHDAYPCPAMKNGK